MNVGFMGLGKLGLPCALAIEEKGHSVVGFDPGEMVAETLRTRQLPYREEGAQELLDVTNIHLAPVAEVVSRSELIFVAVQTPHDQRFEGTTRIPQERRDFNYEFLKHSMAQVAEEARRQRKHVVVAIISTVLPGTVRREIRPLLNEYTQLVYNPFFIAMGTTIHDFLHPEFVLLGGNDLKARQFVERFYATIHNHSVYATTIDNAELIKVSYNTFIGMKIVFVNTLMEICHKTHCSVDAVTDALKMASDRLISTKYLTAGMGDGGGCHPRDNIAMSWLAGELGLSYNFFDSLMTARENQTEWLADLMEEHDLPKVILGKAFKEETNLTVGSPAILLKNILVERGHDVLMYDPHLDAEAPTFQRSVFLIGTRHPEFQNFTYPEGSVVIDPWRYVEVNQGVTLIPAGIGSSLESAHAAHDLKGTHTPLRHLQREDLFLGTDTGQAIPIVPTSGENLVQ